MQNEMHTTESLVFQPNLAEVQIGIEKLKQYWASIKFQ
jgi:hypothetical protein